MGKPPCRAQVQGTVPTGVLEGESFEDDMMDRVFFGAADDDQPFDAVVQFGGAQQETAVAALPADDGLGPWMLKLQTALRFLEGDIGAVAFDGHRLDTEDGDAPALVDHHLQVALLQYAPGRRGNDDGAALFVEIEHAGHSFRGIHLGVPLHGISAECGAFLATDEGGRGGCATVLRTDQEWLLHVVAAFDVDGDAAIATGVVQPPPLPGLTEGCLQTLTVIDDDVAAESAQRGGQQEEEDKGPIHRLGGISI